MSDTLHRFIATAAAGLEKVVQRELSNLGIDSRILDIGRIAFEGDSHTLATANLWLRSADRILLEVGRFPADNFDALFDQTRDLPWFDWIPQDAHFPVNGRSHKSQLTSVPAVQRTVKKAIVECLLDEYGRDEVLPDDPEQGARCIVEVALRNNEAVLTLDTSGTGLHKRGYRQLTGKAPIKETMAAALVMLSHWNENRLLLDPFCGTGTILIEAAMIARDIAPGLERTFDCEDWPGIDPSAFTQARQAAREKIKPNLPLRMVGTDIDEEALSYARHHARRAGVADDIHFQVRDFSELATKHDHGCVITNPPWGQRLGEQEEARRLHEQMPLVFSQLPTWSFFIITPYPDFEGLIGQQANRRRKLYNAQIPCTYYQFWGPPPEGGKGRGGDRVTASDGLSSESVSFETSDAVDGNNDSDTYTRSSDPNARPKEGQGRPLPGAGAVFGGLSGHADVQAEAFANRLVKNARHLRKWAAKGVPCHRLYERDIPEVPLIVDRYHDALHISEHERPNDHSLAQHQQWLDRMADAASEALEIDRDSVHVKTRLKQRGDRQHEKLDDMHHRMVVHEQGLKFWVNLTDYIDTGLFLDHRNARQMVRDRAQGKRVLNLFAYTGAFSVYAAMGGAKRTMTVDLSNTYLKWAQDNFELNGLDAYGDQHLFIRSDAMAFVKEHAQEGAVYDLAVVDPPTFSNSKRVEGVFDVQEDHVELLNGVAKLMAPGGLVYFSNNNRRFKLDEDRLQGFAKVNEISKQTVPEDFRNKRIHRCWAMIAQG